MNDRLRSAAGRIGQSRIFLTVLALALVSAMGLFAERLVSAQQTRSQLPSPTDLSRTFINVAKEVKPAVVNIDVVEKAKRQALRLPEGFPEIPGFGDTTPRKQKGTGSGVIISPDGYILTNNHVAGDADQIKVTLSDGREFTARRVGTDPETDLAVVKIDATGLPFAKLGDSDKVEQGEWVIALGSPFGLQQTMTAGIVSATGRDLRSMIGNGAGTFTQFIQTDASINPGNSGGPLVNMEGEVIGINTLIFSETGTSRGIGFAIPSTLAHKVYAQLMKNGKVTRGYLGVMLGPVTPGIAKSVGYNGTDGAVVADVAREDSPAAKAGLQSGDVITEFEGKPVKSPKELTDMVADSPVGKLATLKYVRDGRPRTATVSLGERPPLNDREEQAGGEDDGKAENVGKLGIGVINLSPEFTRQARLRIASGVVVQNVQPDSPAEEAGLRRGDVIHRINRVPVTDRQGFLQALASIKGEKQITMQIERGGQLGFVTLNLE